MGFISICSVPYFKTQVAISSPDSVLGQEMHSLKVSSPGAGLSNSAPDPAGPVSTVRLARRRAAVLRQRLREPLLGQGLGARPATSRRGDRQQRSARRSPSLPLGSGAAADKTAPNPPPAHPRPHYLSPRQSYSALANPSPACSASRRLSTSRTSNDEMKSFAFRVSATPTTTPASLSHIPHMPRTMRVMPSLSVLKN